jgi:hypothetical protein
VRPVSLLSWMPDSGGEHGLAAGRWGRLLVPGTTPVRRRCRHPLGWGVSDFCAWANCVVMFWADLWHSGRLCRECHPPLHGCRRNLSVILYMKGLESSGPGNCTSVPSACLRLLRSSWFRI